MEMVLDLLLVEHLGCQMVDHSEMHLVLLWAHQMDWQMVCWSVLLMGCH